MEITTIKPHKIVVASDSFKGSLSSAEVGRVCAETITTLHPDCNVEVVELGDGGEGTLDALLANRSDLEVVENVVFDPLLNKVKAKYAIDRKNKQAYIELAKASGLTLIDPTLRNPLNTTSYGTGELIGDAMIQGCTTINLFIGGSATNDAGMGLLMALRYNFYDINGNHITGYGSGADMCHVFKIDETHAHPAIKTTKFRVITDVDAPFCGLLGATLTFASQKGATPPMISQLERGMQRYAVALLRSSGVDVTEMPGAGAAGGIGGALAAMFGAEICPGSKMIINEVGLADKIADADLVITGEGAIDSQTMMGKLPCGVLNVAKKANVPVIAIAGRVELCDELTAAGFAKIIGIHPQGTTLRDALDPEISRQHIAQTITQLLK